MPYKADAAFNFLEQDNSDILISGGAGVGKSTVVRKWISNHPDVLIAAPTGTAALNIGGQTLHSLLGIPIEEDLYRVMREHRPLKLYADKRESIKHARALLIDEISMVRADVLDMVDYTLKRVLNEFDLPFGGLRIVLVGDPFQLPPISKSRDPKEKVWFFESDVWKCNPLQVGELTHIFRQTDKDFQEILNRVRKGEQTIQDLRRLSSRGSKFKDPDSVVLATVNQTADEINTKKLNEIDSPSKTYTTRFTGEFDRKSMSAPENLTLKVGARVLFVRNKYDENHELVWVNGDSGTVEELSDSEIIVKTKRGTFNVGREKWENIERKFNKDKNSWEEMVIGFAVQMPLRLGWAHTVHRSQGSTLEKVHYINERVFSAGQTYTALSRVTSLDGLTVENYMTQKQVIVDQKVRLFWDKFVTNRV